MRNATNAPAPALADGAVFWADNGRRICACVLWPSDGQVFGGRLQIDFGAGLGDDDQDTAIGHEVAVALRDAGLKIRGPIEGGEPLRVALPTREGAVRA